MFAVQLTCCDESRDQFDGALYMCRTLDLYSTKTFTLDPSNRGISGVRGSDKDMRSIVDRLLVQPWFLLALYAAVFWYDIYHISLTVNWGISSRAINSLQWICSLIGV
jgi:hypothetical protein